MNRWSCIAQVAVVMLGACADPADDCTLQICSTSQPSCADHVFRVTACVREVEPQALPKIETIDRDEFRARLEEDAARDQAPEDALIEAQITTLWKALRFLGEAEESSVQAEIDALVANVAAYYSVGRDQVTIIDRSDIDDASRVFVLSHEFVHAQQDDELELSGYFADYVQSFDDEMAIRGLIEGEATLYSNLALATRADVQLDPAQFEPYFDELQANARNRADDPLSPFQAAVSGFPYGFGGAFVTEAWAQAGPEGVAERLANPISDSRTLMTGVGSAPPVGDAVSVSAPLLPAGFALIDDDELGAFMVYILLSRNTGLGADSYGLAALWAGDRFRVAAGPVVDDVAMHWRIRFEAGATAQVLEVAEALRAAAAGSVAGWDVTDTGDTVDVVVATAPEQLSSWVAAFRGGARSGVEDGGREPVAPRPRPRRLLAGSRDYRASRSAAHLPAVIAGAGVGPVRR